MANWSTLKAAIANAIKTNGNQEITGQLLQNVLNNIVSSVGENSTFAGIATPTTNPGVPDGNVFYFAIQAGIYSNFGGVTLTDGLNILLWNGSIWSADNLTKSLLNNINSNVGIDEYPVFSDQTAYKDGDVVNYMGKLYQFTSDHSAGAWTGSDVEPYNLNKDIEERYGAYTDGPEFIRAYTDAEGKFLWGIRVDGSIEWAKGVPTPVQNAIRELKDKLETQDIKSLQDAIDVINASLKPLTDTFSYQDNEEFAHVITDADGKVLFGIKVDGSPYYPNNEMYRVIQNDEYLAAWVDANNKLLFGIKTDGSVYIAKSEYIDAVKEIQEKLTEIEVITENFEVTDNPEFIATTVDNEGKVLEATQADGKKYFPKQALLDKYDDVEGRTEITLDADDRVLSYRDEDGVKHEDAGFSTNRLLLTDNGMKEFQKALKDSGFNPTTPIDWSEKSFIYIPTQPRCAMINITGISAMPESKTADLEGTMEVWDMNGNYFKKNVILNSQGNSSTAMPKKNFAADFVDDDWDESIDIKIGDWVTQDSFHYKAYYTDLFKMACPIGYKMFDEFVKIRNFCNSKPYMEYYEEDYSTSNYPDDDLERNAQFSARCYPDGFPVIVYLNGDFYGIFSWQLKKDRDNYYTKRNKTDNIHLDGDLGEPEIWGGEVKWTSFEVRNPKPKDWVLLCQDGSEYDGDNPKELMGTDSDFYEEADESCVKSAETKTNIEALAQYMAEIAVYENVYNSAEEGEAKTTALATLKSEIEKRFSMDWMIDYILLAVVMQNGDSVRKNWQWVTWGEQNGKMKWFAMPYDLDSGFGIISTTSFSFSAPTSYTIGQGTATPAKYAWAYYLDDMKARYAELRNAGAISYEKVFGLILDWVKSIGYDNYELEYDKWNESPCNRDSNINPDWEYNYASYVTYNDSPDSFSMTTTYSSGDHVKVGRRCYESLQGNNIGHNPTETDSAWWKDVSVKAGTYNTGDVVWDGYSNFYRFKATKEIVVSDDLTGRPFTAFASDYPREGGVFDSIYRISKWIKEKIRLTDEQFDYNV